MSGIDRSSWTAIVADDEAIIRLHIGQIVKKLGGTPILVSNGAQAVEACKQIQPAICFLDINMPVMSGIEAAMAIRKYTCTFIHSVFLVAVSANKLLAELSNAFDLCLDKPVLDTEMSKAVNNALDLLSHHPDDTLSGSQVPLHQ